MAPVLVLTFGDALVSSFTWIYIYMKSTFFIFTQVLVIEVLVQHTRDIYE